MTRVGQRGVCLLWLFAVGGCALATKGEPLRPRYFSPPSPPPARSEPGSSQRLELALGSIRSSEHLRERIVYRESPHEVGYYETRRWAERPEQYLRRAVARSLFEQHGLARVERGPVPVLELELVAFEEVLEPEHLARVQVAYRLHDARGNSFEHTVRVERPISQTAADEALAVVHALGEALDGAVDTITREVVGRLTTAGEAPNQLTVLRDGAEAS